MKTLYKLCILGMICLVSKTAEAQIFQYSEDGTANFIDPVSQKSSERSCFCFAPFGFRAFNLRIDDLGASSLKEEWLYEQQLLLATAMTGTAYFSMYNGPLGLPDNYNFTEIQRDYFKTAETNDLRNRYCQKQHTCY